VAGQEIAITFAQITNPSSTQPTASFVIYSQEQDSGTNYSIDGVESGLTYAVSGLGALSSITVTRDSLNGNNDGLKTGRATNFLFSFAITNEVPTDGAFTIIMPSESDAKISSTSTDFQCSATDCTSGASLACTVTSSTRTVLITDYCTSGSGRSCTASATITFCLKSTFMNNMGWIKTPLTATDSFTIKTGISGGVYFIDGVTESVVATPSLTPDAMSFVSPEITRTSDTVNAKVDWTVNLKFDSNSVDQNGYIYLTLPDDIVYDMGETLTTILTSNSSVEVTNSKTTYSSNAINVITINEICGSSG
jgi:hypothetical protein